jgi:hypothetical protein
MANQVTAGIRAVLVKALACLRYNEGSYSVVGSSCHFMQRPPNEDNDAVVTKIKSPAQPGTGPVFKPQDANS